MNQETLDCIKGQRVCRYDNYRTEDTSMFETQLHNAQHQLNRTEAWDRLNYWLEQEPSSYNLSVIRILANLLRKDEQKVAPTPTLYRIERAFAGDPELGWVNAYDFTRAYSMKEAMSIVANAQRPVVYRMVPA